MVKTVTLLEAKDRNGVELNIYRWSDGGMFYLDCGFDSSGSKAYYELPRGYKTERGARQGAALLTGENLNWSKPCT